MGFQANFFNKNINPTKMTTCQINKPNEKSLINLGVMVVLSVITAYLYFTISPLTKETPELLARTYPTILDVLIAIFGGLALIVAKTKKA